MEIHKGNKENILRKKIAFLFVTVFLVIIFSVSILSYLGIKTEISYSKEKELKTLSQETANKIDRFLFERYGDINVLAESSILSREVDSSLVVKYLKTIIDAYKTYDYILVHKEGYNEIYATTTKDVLEDYNQYLANNKNIIEQKKDDPFISDIIMDSKNKPNVYLYAYIKENSEIPSKEKDIVLTKMNFDSIESIINAVKVSSLGNVLLVDGEGKVIIGGKDRKYSSINIEKNNLKGAGGLFYKQYGGYKLVCAYYSLHKFNSQNSNYYLVIEEPYKEAFAATYRVRNYAFIVSIIAAIITLLAANVMSKGIEGPFKALNSNLQEMEHKLHKSEIREKHLKSLAVLTAGLAHEIRNPLTAIKGYAQYLKEEVSSEEELSGDVNVILNEVERLNLTLNKFLDFAKPDEAKFVVGDINKVLKETEELFKIQLGDRKIKCYLNLGDIPKTSFDESQIKRVFSNIILNAMEAINTCGSITFDSWYNGDLKAIYIKISDTGKGIKEEELDRIFDPFYTTKENGTGLGLPLCSKIIETHGGYIEVNSKYGIGTTFTICLPI